MHFENSNFSKIFKTNRKFREKIEVSKIFDLQFLNFENFHVFEIFKIVPKNLKKKSEIFVLRFFLHRKKNVFKIFFYYVDPKFPKDSKNHT